MYEKYPWVSIITPALNAQETIETTIQSVLNQSYDYIEHIIVDGGSTDRTIEIISKYKNKISKVLTEERKGIYVSINTGLHSVSGDIIGILNADDFYADKDVIRTVVEKIEAEKVDSCWGDLEYVDKDKIDKVIRYWISSEASPDKFRAGWMPPHPAFFVKRWVYEKYGFFNTDFKFAADYEILLRFLYKHKISSCYIPKVLVKMRAGGRGNRSIFWKNIEDYTICRMYGLSFLTFLKKKIIKAPQFVSLNRILGRSI